VVWVSGGVRFVGNKKMKELITSPITNIEFHRYFNIILYDFSPSQKTSERDYEPGECNLLFMVKKLSCNYALVFEKNQFFFKLNFEFHDNQNLDLRQRFYEKLNFLVSDNRFYSQNENSIVLKSQIDEKLIERAHIIFATERLMKSYFFNETKIAMGEIVSMVFEEFKEAMHLVWKTILENFEIVNFPNLLESTEDVSHLLNLEEENRYNLPPIIRIYFDSYNQQKLKRVNNEVVMPMKKKKWLKRIYIFMKKLKTKYK
jgi:hypothetical protein